MGQTLNNRLLAHCLIEQLKKMAVTDNIKKLMDAGVHFGHLTLQVELNMAPYIFMERNGIHVIDLHKTMQNWRKRQKRFQLQHQVVKLFVATKKQAKEIVAKYAMMQTCLT